MMHTKDKLAAALRDVGLSIMADKAATGFYDDFLSPLDTPILTLVDDLAVAARLRPLLAEKIIILRERVKQGQFDATEEESEAWAKSPEGQATFRKLHR